MAAVRAKREVVVWDLGDLTEPLVTIPHSRDIERIAFSPDGRYLATSSANGVVQVWDVIRAEPFGPPLPGALARFSADGTQLLLFGTAGGVWLWDLSRISYDALTLPPLFASEPSDSSKSGTMTAKIEGQGITLKTPGGQFSLDNLASTPLRRVAFSPKGDYLVAESEDLRAWIWDAGTRTLAAPPMPPSYNAALTNCPILNLPMEQRDRWTLSDLAALLGRQRPDGVGGMIPVDEAERARLFTEFRQAHPNEFAVRDERLEHWHQTLAEEAEQAMTWDAAVFHWQEVMKRQTEVRSRESGISCGSRLAYARQAHEVVQAAMGEGRSRWSVKLPRPPWAAPEMLDLDRFYTLPLGVALGSPHPRASFRELASGVEMLGGMGFDVRGILYVSRTNPVAIPIGRACQRIHFLLAPSRPPPPYGTREDFGTCKVTYTSRATNAATLLNPEDVPPYSPHPFYQLSPFVRINGSPGLHSKTAWAGCARSPTGGKEPVFLTRMTWTLPDKHRGEIVETLELQARPADGALLIFAITVE